MSSPSLLKLFIRSCRCLQNKRLSSQFGLLPSKQIHISATPTVESRGTRIEEDDFLSGTPSDPADARFEVLGPSNTILSVSLSASQNLYTRRGTLVGISGKVQNTRSKLSILEPFRRSLLGVPFLYQNISSTSPITALISTKSSVTSFTVLNLNGTIDWIISQPMALIAWTGQNLSISPKFNQGSGIAHRGNTKVMGRGLIALSGYGNIYRIRLKAGEEYIANVGNLVAYTESPNQPQPYRHSNFHIRVPSIGAWLRVSDRNLVRSLRATNIWLLTTKLFTMLRTFMRRIVWGNQLFLKFSGPTTILISSRADRISNILTSREINDMFEANSESAPHDNSSIKEEKK
ncbi:Altered inheritance of mitochondria protein 24, mitochondrial [Golovinomyces cichoracearum]|uniref:Altered inheritance of mitochondria protein 24, mitochondrial n=1 Tax=Golovinomyces cichoracearum TaxID=62708 RepID=A0A420HDQ1_9PEZI|nr:Altered inheritance of mitochondria protein 24, mitochondrial [Golovinomyces cichoracearum]